MSANNTFNIRRFFLLARQHFIHNNRIMLYSMIGSSGVAFVVLSLVELDDLSPFNAEHFMGFFVAFVAVFGILFIGHSFPAFRSKETTTNYLTVPASTLEKFLFELIYRVGSTLFILPILFWLTFHLQGYFFQLFIEAKFVPVGFSDLMELRSRELDASFWVYTMVGSLSLLAITVPFLGAAHFSKQPLVKTLFSVAVLILFFAGLIYIVFEHLGLEKYRLNDSLWLLPNEDKGALKFFSIILILANLLMLLVTFLKVKEKEV